MCNTSQPTVETTMKDDHPLSSPIRKCSICGSDFVEVLEYPNGDRVDEIRIVMNSNANVPQSYIQYLSDILREVEDRNIIEARANANFETVSNQALNEDIVVKNPASKEYVDSLVEVNLSEENQDLCAICREDFKPSNKGVILKCNHIFHKDCITDWFGHQNSCPVCKTKV